MMRDFCSDNFSSRFYQRIGSFRTLYLRMLIGFFQFFIWFKRNGKLRIGNLLRHNFLGFDHISGFENRIAALSLVQNIIEFIVSSEHDCVHITISCTLTIW